MNLSDAQFRTLMVAVKTSGVFVTSGLEHPNVMSTHWGTCGMLWNEQVFILPVRPSKLSHDLIEQTKCFAISVPKKDMRNEIIECDHLSGFKVNKFEALQLHPQRAQSISTYVLGECGLIIECKVVFSADMIRKQLDPALAADMYSTKDFHTMYFGIMENIYENE